MRYLKIVLGFMALVLAAAQYALTGGLWNLSPSMIAGIGAAASFLFALGIQPIVLPARASQVLGALAGLLAAISGIHAANVSRSVNPHPFVWATVGALGILMGAIGRLQMPPKPSAPPAPPVEPGP